MQILKNEGSYVLSSKNVNVKALMANARKIKVCIFNVFLS